jgi:hypothetical protein
MAERKRLAGIAVSSQVYVIAQRFTLAHVSHSNRARTVTNAPTQASHDVPMTNTASHHPDLSRPSLSTRMEGFAPFEIGDGVAVIFERNVAQYKVVAAVATNPANLPVRRFTFAPAVVSIVVAPFRLRPSAARARIQVAAVNLTGEARGFGVANLL